jgi:hypothetical protein
MAKKVNVVIRDKDDDELATFKTKTLTKLFNDLAAETEVKVYIQENNFGEQFVGDYVTKAPPNEPGEPASHDCPDGQHWDDSLEKCVDDVVIPSCPAGQHFDPEKGQCVPDVVVPPTCPPGTHWDAGQQKCVPDVVTPPTGNVLYDSHVNSKLHDGQTRTIKSEGVIAPNGLGVECRASGNPRIQVNSDGTFSLLCDKGHGRLYFYVLNYNATMELECAFWKTAGGQDCSLKMRSRHNEPGKSCAGGSPIDGNRFGGYGLAVDKSNWDAKREPTHNCHDQSKSGSLNVPTGQQFFKIEFTVKDDGTGKVKQIGKLNGQHFMDKTDDSPKPFMVDQALYAKQSYFWIRQNIDSGTGELRIKSLKIIKA